jgi:hypothetical protein
MNMKNKRSTYRVWSVDCLSDGEGWWTMNDRSEIGSDTLTDHAVDKAWSGDVRLLRRAMQGWLQPNAHVEFDMEEGGFWVLAPDGYILYQFELDDSE